MNNDQQGGRMRFDNLFTDPRHYRGDCRLVRTAIRRGWLDREPPEVKAALVAKLGDSMDVADKAPTESQYARSILAMAWAYLEAEQRGRSPYVDGIDALDKTTGRPRERWNVTEMASRIDADEIRRRALAEGLDLARLRSVEVRAVDALYQPGERIALEGWHHRTYGWRWWLVCPGCQRRRVHLYSTKAGARCRVCGRIGYR